MKTILLTLAIILAGSAGLAQDRTLQRQAEGARDAMLLSRTATARFGMVIAPGYRSNAVNAGGSPALIARGDADYSAALTNEPAADALRAQGDTLFAAGNYGPASNRYGLARQEYENCNSLYVGSQEWWKRALFQK